jgi:lipopolysaccharide transport system ATP-binding protein
MAPAVRIENLSKLYRIGARQQAHYRTLRESLVDAAAAPWRRWRELRNQSRVHSHELNGHAGDCPEFVQSAEQGTDRRLVGTVPFAAATNGRVANNGHAGDCPDFAMAAVQDEKPVQNGTVPLPPAASRLPPAPLTTPPDTIWALNDVSFDVQHGEVVGIIGRNGAGKSTLLKILSRITEPTSGRVTLNGRVASLLEVGTGFHPELTGRENIYLNGAILGMHRHEIRRKFDAIVDFSGIDQFLDTPVKRYSSGMYVRLAFAVAAHLDPEILIVDEVLAVGDAEFQKKCIGKMQDVAKGGRTVLFVSHNLSVLENFCTGGVLLAAGLLHHHGEIHESIRHYLHGMKNVSEGDIRTRRDRRGKGEIRFESISVAMGPKAVPNFLMTGKPAEFRFRINQIAAEVGISFTICDQRGSPVCNLDTWRRAPDDVESTEAEDEYMCFVPELPLRSGRYFINAQVGIHRELQDSIDAAVTFDVENGAFRGRSMPYPSCPGIVCLDHKWSIPSTPTT